ncbi:MAG: PPC domain-containing protein [Kofleriaceae bacterium]|nr:PPC domain-containing protein [Kofleriaceae bacterium]
MALCVSLGAACSSEGPQLSPVADQVAAVGRELVVEVNATNMSGKKINFSYTTSADIVPGRVNMRTRSAQSALFTWTPAATDIGTWTFDFHASDAEGSSSQTVTIEVRSAIGQDSRPIFRRPLGAGTSIDLASEDCIDIEIVIEDQDSAEVILTEQEPKIPGATLSQDGGLIGQWSWCPTKAQSNAQDRYLLTIGADDSQNPLTLKNYQIILRDSSVNNCPGQAPVIVHQISNQSTSTGIEISAQVQDDQGIKGAVNLYYSNMPIGDTPALGALINLPMELASGTILDGVWTAQLPNPVAGGQSGDTGNLYYAIVADDNDDRMGSCDHTTTEVFGLEVTHPGGLGGLPLCASCTDDQQCGTEDDLCISTGGAQTGVCFSSCATDDECPSDYFCGPEVDSLNGARAKQCQPMSGTCEELQCQDDVLEDNDGITQAFTIEPGVQADLRLCPVELHAADEDWFTFTVTEDADVTLQINGDQTPNLDLRLLDSTGNLIAASEDFGSSDSISRCLTPGTYSLRVYSNLFFSGQDPGNSYTLEYTSFDSLCEVSSCDDDIFEDDDNAVQARIPDFGGLGATEFTASNNTICEADQDWYLVSAFNNLNHLSVRLDFTQSVLADDLDVLLYDSTGTLLTQCTAADPSDCNSNGQSSTSNEYFTWQPPDTCSLPIDCEGCAPCDYFIVVNGFDGAFNDYDICIGYGAGDLCIAP